MCDSDPYTEIQKKKYYMLTLGEGQIRRLLYTPSTELKLI